MMTAAKVVQCIASFSHASLSPALMLQRGMATQLHCRFVSSSWKDGKAGVKVDLGERPIDASDLINKTKLNPTEVGNSLTAGILKQTTIVGTGSISGSGQERGLRRGTHAYSMVFAFGEPYRIAQEENKYIRTSEPFLSQNSIGPSTILDDNYIYKRYRNKQSKQFTRTFWTMGHHKADEKKSKPEANTEDSEEEIGEANLTRAPKRRNRKWTTSYSNMTIPEAEERLKLTLELPAIPVKQMLEGKSVLLGPKVISEVKREIYKSLVSYMKVGGYPTEANPDFMEANINDIVVLSIYPLLSRFADETMRNLRLSREKEITSKDFSTSGREEFVVMDYISYNQKNYILVVESKKVSLGEARKQCFLAMKDMRDCNGGGTVYGFVTMGDMWRFISFDGKFKMSEPVLLLFETMGKDEERWIAGYSVVVDCFNVALSNGAKGLVEVV